MTTLLTEQEFKSTFGNKMTDVTDTAETAGDIWPYARLLHQQNIITESVLNHELVEYVYRSDTQMFDHVLLSGPKANIYVTIVVDLNEVVIKGHYILDLNTLYGI